MLLRIQHTLMFKLFYLIEKFGASDVFQRVTVAGKLMRRDSL